VQIPTKKLKCGFEMPVFGLGTWLMGGDKKRNPNNDDQADIRAIQTAINLGITHIDTAENYAEGHAEELVGQAIRGFPREKLFLVSKVSPEHLRGEDVLKSAKASLQRLQTEYLDLYLIHAPNSQISIKETMEVMDLLLEEGLIKNIGVSNFNIQRFEEAQSYTKNKIVANQLHYNLIIREVERKGLVDYCHKNDVILVAYRPLQKGEVLQKGREVLEEIGKKYQKTPAQIAINWLVSQSNVVTISKMGSRVLFKENLGAVNWEMAEEDIEKLRRDFPEQEEISKVCALT